MLHADAQHPTRRTTHETGALRLTKAHHPIAQGTYFRQTFFDGLPWDPDTRPRRAGGEAVEVPFEASLLGRPPYVVRLLVAHDPKRESGQHNFATSIHWGELMDELHAADYTGQVVTLERCTDRTFRLNIGPTETGPFVP
jgi:hypothetical protein